MIILLFQVQSLDVYKRQAIDCTPDSLDSRLKRLPADKQDYLKKTFDFMIEQALKLSLIHISPIISAGGILP